MSIMKLMKVLLIGITLVTTMASATANARPNGGRYYPGYGYPYPNPTCYSCGIIIGPGNPNYPHR